MADAQTNNAVQQAVLDFVRSMTMFTAYDVTLAVRNQGVVARHGEVRDVVHSMFQDGILGAAWQRTAVDIGTDTRPLVYHHFNQDPRTYKSPSTGSAAKPATNSGQSGSPSPGSAASGSGKGFFQRIVGAFFGQGRSPGTPSNHPASGGAQVPSQPLRTPKQRPPITIDLDASAYLPISRSDLLSEAKKTNLWGSPWFGRRDLIPPVEDDRTKLIDRAMLTQGLLTPEQLTEIHRVGAEMDKYRPDQLLINQKSQKAGQAAVDEERQSKAALKKQKKEEAALRKQLHRQAVADRKANDIVFLGRGVSSRLGDRTSDDTKLQAAGLPVMSTPSDLANALSITVPQLRWLAFHSDVASRTHYVNFTIPRKSGGVRILSAPHRRIAAVQQWILAEVVSRLPVEDCAHGFVPNRSILTNARPHVGQQVVLNMDLENFFPGITYPRVRRMFQTIGYSGSVATILALLCTECPRRTVTWSGEVFHVACGPRGLPQGACTSPAISNQVVKRLDRRLQGLARKHNLVFTRYADDLTFSGGSDFDTNVAWVMACVRHIAEDEGLVVNEKKNRVLRRNTAQIVTGLVVNDKPSVSRKKLRQIRAILHRAQQEGLESQNRDGHPNFRAYLDGYISFISMTRPEIAARLKEQLANVS
ncbi:MAG: reverse transcriptase domain-containing protein [Planctomycetaceae bacterium]